jgi:predicted unusual protein kinase regulating ubiquinone biosynthesis (AarF/ABC1/UbiB family)
MLQEQIDLSLEASNLERFRYNFRHRADVTFPEPILYSERVLVESWESGIPIQQVSRWRQSFSCVIRCRSMLITVVARATERLRPSDTTFL